MIETQHTDSLCYLKYMQIILDCDQEILYIHCLEAILQKK